MKPLAVLAARLLGDGVSVAGGPVEKWLAPLWPEEEAATLRMEPIRQAEFAAGRAAAREALKGIGVDPVALPRRPDGPPLWPPGTTGSLGHGGGVVLAAVGRLSPRLTALGLDLEPFAPLPPELAREVCHDGEDFSRALEVFGAKGAAFKAQFAVTGRALDFGALRVAFGRWGRTRATLAAPVGPLPKGTVIPGRQARAGALLVSAARLP